MEDLAGEFEKDFIEAVEALEGFASADDEIRAALAQIRVRIAARKYTCAPDFWEDLRSTLGAIEQHREDRSLKSKAQQVLKRVAQVELRFDVKESISMLRELDPQSRLERLTEWLQTFDANEAADASSSGPAVLFQVLNDITLQRDMDQAQKEALAASVRDNISKFPVEWQAVLERVGVQSGLPGGARALSDWRRRHLPAAAQGEPATGGAAASAATRSSFVPPPSKALHDAMGIDGVPLLPGFAGELPAVGGVAGHSALGEAPPILAITTAGEDRQHDDEEEALMPDSFSIAEVDPEMLEKARQRVLGLLEANYGEIPKHYVREIMKQAGLAGLPFASLGEEVFYSPSEVFLRAKPPVEPPTSAGRGRQPRGEPIPEEVRQEMVAVIKEAGGRIAIAQLAERMQWKGGSARHNTFGAIKKALSRVPEVFYDPQKVFSATAVEKLIVPPTLPSVDISDALDGALLDAAQLAEAAAAAAAAAAEALAAASGVQYVADPFAELITTVLSWLQQAGGVLSRDAVVPLIKAMSFKPRAVIAALARDVFWSHPEAECQILLRTPVGAAAHPRPLPEVYLHKQVHIGLLKEVRNMGAKAKADKLAGALNWNQKSELRRTYGDLRGVVLVGLREVFYDPTKLYLKRVIDGLVEWPVGREGRLGPPQHAPTSEEEKLRHWTAAADDLKGAGDPTYLNAKRQIIGTVMRHGGRCDVLTLRRLLHPILEQVDLEALFEPGSPHDLSQVLFWGRRQVHIRRASAIDPNAPQPNEEEQGLPPGCAMLLTIAVRSKGVLGASLDELKARLEEAGQSHEEVREEVGDAVVVKKEEASPPPEVEGERRPSPKAEGAEVAKEVSEAKEGAGGSPEPKQEDALAIRDNGAAHRSQVDEERLCALLEQIPELLFMPGVIFMRHIAETVLIEGPELPPQPTTDPFDEEASAEAYLAAVAESMGAPAGGGSPSAPALPPPPVRAALGAPLAEAAVPVPPVAALQDADPASFFSFNEFSPSAPSQGPRPAATSPSAAAGGDSAASAAKRRRLSEGEPAAHVWGSSAAPWATEGAVVLVRAGSGAVEQGEPSLRGVIVRAHSGGCTVRLTTGGVVEDRDFPTPSLVPVAPKVGATVKVVDGDRAQGCCGSLVDLAGPNGVVQINKMLYETLPMSHLVVVEALA